jgi:hypothetical protein
MKYLNVQFSLSYVLIILLNTLSSNNFGLFSSRGVRNQFAHRVRLQIM